jgi:hypothetical protein
VTILKRQRPPRAREAHAAHRVANHGRARPSVSARPMASAELSRRVGKVVTYPPLSELSDLPRREFHEALLEAATFEDLHGKWQAAILEAEQKRPELRLISSA